VPVVDKTIQKEAWQQYLDETTQIGNREYESVEPYAWARLQARLGQLKPKKVTSHAKVG
jgi:hypothetical protein